MKRIIITLSLFLLIPICGMAQQQLLSTQYIYNRILINPAYTGMDNGLSMSVFARDQWGGLEGAPNTQAFSIHSPIDKDQTAALGGVFIRDEIGVTVQNITYLTGSYKLQLSDRSFLSVGLQGGFVNNNIRYSELPDFARDPAFSDGDINEFRPNFGFGLYFISQKFHAGFSVPNFIQKVVDDVDNSANNNVDRVYYFDFGYQFQLSPDLTLNTDVLGKLLIGDPTQIDFYSVLGIKEKVWVGASYRSETSFNALFRARLGKGFFMGYSYDFASTNELSVVSSGSHELMLQFQMSKK